jgi:hypothetical protein
MQQHLNTVTPKELMDGVISVEDALSIVDHYGPTGADVNETFQIQMVLRDKVREQEEEIANLRAQLQASNRIKYGHTLPKVI